jgi:hypothetical protein
MYTPAKATMISDSEAIDKRVSSGYAYFCETEAHGVFNAPKFFLRHHFFCSERRVDFLFDVTETL